MRYLRGKRASPPELEWEAPLWRQFEHLVRQWRMGPLGPTGIDMAVWIPVIKARGWRMDVALELLAAIEAEWLAE